jgi:hypothetical protein
LDVGCEARGEKAAEEAAPRQKASNNYLINGVWYNIDQSSVNDRQNVTQTARRDLNRVAGFRKVESNR